MRKPLEDMRDSNGQLPAYSWPGCYPLYYITESGLVVCAGCADADTSDPAAVADTNWEDDDLYCEDCGTRIPSAYGEEGQDDA